MNKLFFTLLLGIISTFVYAQEVGHSSGGQQEQKTPQSGAGWAVFLKLGMAQASFHYSDTNHPPYYSEEAIWRPSVGVGFQVPLHANIALRPEVTYAVKQFNFMPVQYDPYYYTYQTQSLRVGHFVATLPVVGRLGIGNTAVYLGAGPYYSMALAGGNFRTRYYGSYTSIKVDTEATEEHLKKQDYGISAMAGTSLRIGKVSVGVEIKYEHGLVNNYGAYGSYFFPDEKRYARTIGVSLLFGTAGL